MTTQNETKNLGKIISHKNPGRTVTALTGAAVILGTCLLFAGAGGNKKQDIQDDVTDEKQTSESIVTESYGAGVDILPTGIAGVVSGVNGTVVESRLVERIGTSCEQVMVGQRIKKIEENVAEFDISASMESSVNYFEEKSLSMSQSPALMSDEDYDTLLHIVEAEAGTEDIKGKILVANVIMNRVKNEEFPNTVTEVVWERTNGVPQFSPTYDGRIHEVTISEETREAVRQVLEGTDYSEGALFFIQKSEAEKHNVSWFEKDLKKLFKYGVHEFYTYSDN